MGDVEYTFVNSGARGCAPAGVVACVSAVALAAAKGREAPILLGVELTAEGDGITFAATDRYVLHAGRVDMEGIGESVSVVVPAVALDKAIKAHKRSFGMILTVTAEGVSVRDYDGASVFVPELSGGFPQWRTLVPTAACPERGVHLSADPGLMGRSLRAVDLLSTSKPPAFLSAQVGPDKPIIMEPRSPMDGVSFVALVMPVRDPDCDVSAPLASWVHGSSSLAAAAS